MCKKNDGLKVICPICNQVISDFEEYISDPCEHVLLIYTDAVCGEFVHIGAGMETVASEMEYSVEEGDYDYLSDAMKHYEQLYPECIMVETETEGMSCGPCSNTEYVLIKGQ